MNVFYLINLYEWCTSFLDHCIVIHISVDSYETVWFDNCNWFRNFGFDRNHCRKDYFTINENSTFTASVESFE